MPKPLQVTEQVRVPLSADGVDVWYVDNHWELVLLFGAAVEALGGPSRTEAVEQLLTSLTKAAARPLLDEIDRNALQSAKDGLQGLTVSRSMVALWICPGGDVLYEPRRCSEAVHILGSVDAVTEAINRCGRGLDESRPVRLDMARQDFVRRLVRPRARHPSRP